MNENIDLTKILKDCPKGWKFWSPIFGEVEFERNFENKGFVNVSLEDGTHRSFHADATITIGYIKSIEIMLYPSRSNRDWNQFSAPWLKRERFDPKTLRPFNKVLVRDLLDAKWHCDLFSHVSDDNLDYPYATITADYAFCIPYNDGTKHLAGNTEEAPEYYRYWEV